MKLDKKLADKKRTDDKTTTDIKKSQNFFLLNGTAF